MHMQHSNAIIMPALLIYCGFQQNSLSPCQYQTLWHWYCCRPNITLCPIQLRSDFYQGGDTGHGRKVTVETVAEVYPNPSRLGCLGSAWAELPSGVWGWAPAETMFGRFIRNFCAIYRRILVHFGGWLSGKITPKIQDIITGVGIKVTLHECI